MKKAGLIFTLLLIIIVPGCNKSTQTPNLMDNIQKSDLSPIEISDPNNKSVSRQEEITNFSLKLLNESFEDENILISPLSIVSALGMVTNGAEGNTLYEMEKVLNSDIQGLNDYIKAYTTYIPNEEQYKVNLANSIWFKDDKSLEVNQEFLQINKDYYDANVYKAPFDESTKNDINNWVKEKTSGMIESLLEEAPPADAIMYLINALSFDAEWEEIYKETQIYDGDFTLEKGEKKKVEMMQSMESSYLENESITGFIKPYKDSKYAFVAMLPKDNIPMTDLMETLDGESLMDLIENHREEEVYVSIPKFSVEYSTLLNEPLKAMGILDAFDGWKADFTKLGYSVNGNIYISRVIHKTKIDVDEKGTKAGAVTAVELKAESAAIEEPKRVILDRPFFYMIVDTDQNLPLFMGCLMGI